MLGRRTRCASVEIDCGPIQSICAWTTFLSKPVDQQMILISNIRGGKIMYIAIENALSNINMQIGSATQKWMGLFTPLDVLIGVNAYIVLRNMFIRMGRRVRTESSGVSGKLGRGRNRKQKSRIHL